MMPESLVNLPRPELIQAANQRDELVRMCRQWEIERMLEFPCRSCGSLMHMEVFQFQFCEKCLPTE